MTAEEANALMKRGIELLEANTPESLAEAVPYFDRAIEVRRGLFTAGDHRAAFLLAASCMNRGDVLTRLGGEARLAEALRSYDEALAVLCDAPAETDPQYRRRHAIAWLHRGLTLLELGTAPALDEAVRSFERAIAATNGHPEHGALLASAALNHARALLTVEPPHADEARRSAVLALEQVREMETQAPLAAEIHLKAQILLCRAAETSLFHAPDTDPSRELIAAATDAVETGLLLARHWQERGDAGLGPLPTILFRFGLDIYLRRQPQFLCEFVRETLQHSVSLEWHRLAAEALTGEAHAIRKDGFAYLNTPRHELLTEIQQTLGFVEQRIHGLNAAQGQETV